ncbi:MAG: dockerin type I domain-containing protein [Phycisphaerales bacterium]|nr:dockerin type I domain-containing protein [Phycisphaerales bacterium]
MKHLIKTTTLLASLVTGTLSTGLFAGSIEPTYSTEKKLNLSLGKMIEHAEHLGTIEVPPGTHNLNLSIENKSLTIVGGGKYPSDTVISNVALPNSPYKSRHTLDGFLYAETFQQMVTITFENITFASDPVAEVSGFLADDVNLVFRNCRFMNLQYALQPVGPEPFESAFTACGGAMRLYRCHLTVEDCLFSGNRVVAHGVEDTEALGGAIYAEKSKLDVLDSTFTMNTAMASVIEHPIPGVFDRGDAMGGAIYTYNSNLNIEGTAFTLNTVQMTVQNGINPNTIAWARGGAISCMSNPGEYSKQTISNCLFEANHAQVTDEYAPSGGGALHFGMAPDHGRAIVEHCVFTSNSASAGTAIMNLSNQAIIMYNDFLCDGERDLNLFSGEGIDGRGNFFESCNDCPYDVNADGNVDQDDYDLASRARRHNQHHGPEDVNGDGRVDNTDLALIRDNFGGCVAEPEPCLYDLNGDGVVDQVDRRRVSSAIRRGNHDGPEDVNGDGQVDRDDMNLIQDNYGECP